MRFLHLTVVSMEASVGSTNEFCLLVLAVLVAKPETIEGINGAFNPLNHAVSKPSILSRHHFIIFTISREPSLGPAKLGLQMISCGAEHPLVLTRTIFSLEAK